MEAFQLRNRVLGFVTLVSAVVLLSGCAGSANPVAGARAYENPGASPRVSSSLERHSSSGDLLYTSSTSGSVYIYSYPQGKRVGELTGFNGGAGMCTDPTGDVFIPSITNSSTGASTIYEYAHGGTQPIAELSDTGTAFGCSVDPLTGNLAVANIYDTTNPYSIRNGSVAVYAAAQGSPNLYYSSSLGIELCGYDNKGNLYLSVFNGQQNTAQLARLAKGGDSISLMTLNVTIDTDPEYFTPFVQWDGKHVTISSYKGFGSPVLVYQLAVSGNQATAVGTTNLDSKKNHHAGQSWIQGNKFIGIALVKSASNVALWSYPKGGSPTSQIKKVIERNIGSLDGVVVSRGSTH
jgi:hypothetical protein